MSLYNSKDMGLIKQFDKDIVINAILYIAQQMGGMVDMHKLFKTMYFADREHLSKYGRRVSGDTYIAMQYGPVPSMTDDILKAVRGDSFFSENAKEFKKYFHFVNRFVIEIVADPDLDYLSESDIECLDNAIGLCRDKSFAALTSMSHDLAWNNTAQDRPMSFGNIMREIGESEEYAEYIERKLDSHNAYC